MFKVKEETEAEAPLGEQMKTWTPPVFCSLGSYSFPGFFCSLIFAGHFTVHSKDFIFSCQYTRLKPNLCPGWYALGIVSNSWPQLKKKKSYLWDCMNYRTAICRTKSWEEEEVDCLDDVRKTPFRRPCVSGSHVSYGWGWVYSKYWPNNWETAGGTKTRVDAGESPPVLAPWGWSVKYL